MKTRKPVATVPVLLLAHLAPYEVDPPAPYRPKRRTRRTFPGKCYSRAFSYVSDHADTDVRLVHGMVGGAVVAIEHAWVEIPGGIVFDGALNRFYEADAYARVMGAVAEASYTVSEMYLAALRDNHTGPWHTGLPPRPRKWR